MTMRLVEHQLRGRVAYPVKEAAEKTGLSQKTIHRRIADGTLKARRVGRRWLVSAASLEALGE